ncbi:MAG: hypothetical protein VB062_01925 [Christensenella sp.]|nr:hypothetical protein [Christensenella sp.]
MNRNVTISRRALAFAAAVALLFTFGCGQAAADKSAAEEVKPEIVAVDDGSANTESAGAAENVSYAGIYHVDETTDEAASGSYASSTPDENTVLVENAGVLTMNSADLNKTGDAESDFSAGTNAAVAVVSGGQMSLQESNVTSNARGGFGLFAGGAGATLNLGGSFVYTSGESSPALVVRGGGVVSLTGGTLSTEGEDSPCLLLSGGIVTLSGVTLSATSGEQLRVLSGTNELTLDNTVLSAKPVLAEGTTLKLVLVNGASFTGELGATLPAKVSVSLDAASKLILTADTNLVTLINADTTHQNIQSNGFSIYYDSNAPENAYLESQSFALPGGGYLTPII